MTQLAISFLGVSLGATALCNMRTAGNIRQAVIVITDGVDEHSRLVLDQSIHLATRRWAIGPQRLLHAFIVRPRNEQTPLLQACEEELG